MKSYPKRYKARTPKKKKISFEKKIFLQSIASVIILVYCLIVSNTETATVQKEYINRAVNITDTKTDIKNMMTDIFAATKSGISKSGEYISLMTDRFGSGFSGSDDTKNTALAQPAIYPEVPEELSENTEPAPTPEPQPAPAEEPPFRRPLEGTITSPFGQRVHPIDNTGSTHYGIDIAGNHGDCVISSLPGTVEETGFDNGLGNYVKIRHSESLITVYGHLSEIHVRKGEAVDGNTRIGSVGSTGAATGPHLHFEVRLNGASVDPAGYFTES
ncbi:MAG: M23 family metallopeptidase [Clostridia bacterium]|nr:M23 family metallopeptidase [Clostridia bacterium]